MKIFGADEAFSSHNWIIDLNGAAPLAERFWNALLGADLEGAYQCLPSDFRTQLSFASFSKLTNESGILKLGKPAHVDVATVRLADRLDRPLDAMLAAYLLATYEDGTVQPLRCEFRYSRSSGAQLLNFSTDFESAFPGF